MAFFALNPAAQEISIYCALRYRLGELMASGFSPLLLQDFLNLTDFSLNFAGYFFIGTFSF